MKKIDLKLSRDEIRLIQLYRQLDDRKKLFCGGLIKHYACEIPEPRVLQVNSSGRAA